MSPSLKTFMISLLTAIVVVIIMLRFYGPSSSTPALETKKAETTFERIARTGVIRCGYGTWPPYLMKDPNTGQLSGMNYEVMEAIGRNLELKIEWTEEVGWGNYIEGINTKRYDMFCASVWPNGPRTKNTTLSKPTFYSAAYALARIDDHRFDGDLSKVNDPAVKISVIEGDYTESLAKEDYPKASRNVLSPNSDGAQVLLEIASGKADIAFADLGLFREFEKNNPGKLTLVPNTPPSRIFGEHLSVGLGEFELKNALDTAITTLSNSGVIAKIIKQYQGGSTYAPAPDFAQ